MNENKQDFILWNASRETERNALDSLSFEELNDIGEAWTNYNIYGNEQDDYNNSILEA